MDQNLNECVTQNNNSCYYDMSNNNANINTINSTNELFEIPYNELQSQLKQFISLSRIFDDDTKFIVKNEDGTICHKVTICRRKNYI